MSKFLELFEPIQKGDFGLTDEAIYKSIENEGDFIPIWGGNKSHSIIDRLVSKSAKTKQNVSITIFAGEGIIISLDGSAGSMTYKSDGCFSLNHHAGFFKVKEDAKQEVLPEFFALFYQAQFTAASVSEGSKTLTLDQVYLMEFDLPSFDVQKVIMGKIHPLSFKKQKIIKTLGRIDSLKQKILSSSYHSYQTKGMPISNVLGYLSGNSGLTEEVIYQQIDNSEARKHYEVLSSSTIDRTKMGIVPRFKMKNDFINVFEDKEGILTIRNGRAGQTYYLRPGKYTLNDHAYILFLKNQCPYKISLKWLMFQYKDAFLDYVSSSDNGTWNMTGFFENVIIDIPSYSEQIVVVKKYERLGQIEEKLNGVEAKIEDIFMKQIV